ncbi:MAG: toll/interleukin-1 receptor domain-containing protein [Chloroflexota bacterium]
MADVFISYAREDTEFVKRVVDNFHEIGRDVWIDFDDIPFGAAWWDEIVEGIEKSSVCVFVISPDSIASQVCSLERADLMQNNKKIVPIVARDPEEDIIVNLPQVIQDLNWVNFDLDAPFEDMFASLVTAIDTDLDEAKSHTRLLVRTVEWTQRNHSTDLLARGEELATFLPMLQRDDLTTQQRVFIEMSLNAARARYNFWRFVFGFLGGLLGMAYYVAVASRSPIITPSIVTNVIAAGEVFGLFTGIIAVFSANLPSYLRERLPAAVRVPVQVVVCFVAGTLAWIIFQWFFLQIPLQLTYASFVGGVGLSLGFIFYTLLRPPAYITFLLTAVFTFMPIYLLNSASPFYQSLGWANPLIYFDSPNHVWTIGLPMALLLAVGSNGLLLWQWLAGQNQVTYYLIGRRKRKNDEHIQRQTPATA